MAADYMVIQASESHIADRVKLLETLVFAVYLLYCLVFALLKVRAMNSMIKTQLRGGGYSI